MSKKVFVKPASPDLLVPDERGRPIPAQGKNMTLTVYLRRRIKEGALIESEAKATVETPLPEGDNNEETGNNASPKSGKKGGR